MKRFEHQWPDFKWVDIEEPSSEDLAALTSEFEVPSAILVACLDSEHLPQCEFYKDCLFFILRHQDMKAKPKAATMQELSTKLVFFVGRNFLLTIHRQHLPCTAERRDVAALAKMTLMSLVKSLCIQTVRSFEPALDDLDAKTDVIEERVFSLKRKNILREGYVIKRKASSYRKIFKFTSDVFQKIPTEIEIAPRDLAQVREPLDKLIFYSESIYEEITGLLNLHLSLMSQVTNEASFRTSEVMRVLTVFSIFFLPLNFIAGIYGMNFENMPELKDPRGYHTTLGFMLFLVLAITFWIYRKGWLKNEGSKND